MKQIDPAAFCSRGSYVHVPFCSEVPESSKLEDVCEASFWSLLPKMISRSQNLLHKGQVIRLHTPDFSWDTLFVIVGFRADTTPMLRRWPIDEKSSATESIPGEETESRSLGDARARCLSNRRGNQSGRHQAPRRLPS